MGKPNYGYIGVALTILQLVYYKFEINPQSASHPSPFLPLFAGQAPEHNLELEYRLQPGRFSVFE